jgi:hypothetical protein
LAAAVRRHWLPIIYDQFSNADAHHLEMVVLGHWLDPRAMRTLLREKLLRDALGVNGLTCELREFARCWDKGLAEFVAKVTANQISNPVTVGCIMQHLAEHDPRTALVLWKRLGKRRRKDKGRYVAATAALASWRLFDLWHDLWPVLKAKPALARKVFLAIDAHDGRNYLQGAGSQDLERRLADLYLYRYQLFPPEKDPVIPPGRTVGVTREMEMARLRDELPDVIASMGTEAAADELLRVANELRPRSALWVRWRWRDAVVSARRKAWRPPTPELVLALVRKSSARWVSDEDALVALVMESLGRLDKNLTSEPNSQRRDFWRERRSRTGQKFYSPCSEVDASRRIATWLQSDLAKGLGITLQREVQIQWDKRTDIEIRAVAREREGIRQLEVILEVKGC